MPEPRALADLFVAGRDPAACVAYQRGVPRDLAFLGQRVRAWHATFAAAQGSRFVLHFEDALEFAAALFGLWHAGKCAVVPSDMQAALIGHSGLIADGHAGVEGGLVPSTPATGPLPPIHLEAPLLEMFTSGSTGEPASIPKCVRQLEQEVAGLCSALDWGAADAPVLGTVSHQHMYGFMFRLLLPLALQKPFEARRVPHLQDLAGMRGIEGCVVVSNPAQLERLPPAQGIRGRIAVMLSAGGPLAAEAARECAAVLDVVPTEIYGSTETGALAWRRRSEGDGRWQPLPGVELGSEAGVLRVRTRQLPTDEWFCTADRLVEGASGFELAGRTDRIVKLAEKRVSLDAVERALMDSGLLRKARALVLAGPRTRLGVIALPQDAGWMRAEGGKRALALRLQQCLRGSAQVEVLPRSWRFVDPWPVTVDGKTPDLLLRERFDPRNPEFRVLEQHADHCVLDLWVSPTAPFFAGHFPGHPVLPGVAQIEWLVWLSRLLLGEAGGFAGLEAAKFRRVIAPGSTLRVSLKSHRDTARTAYQISNENQVCASGRIRWSAPA